MTTSFPAGSPPTPERAPTVSEILGYFSGAIELMRGRSEGLRRLDLTADGFWTSFFAMLVALPPMALSWVEYEDVERSGRPAADAGAVLVYGLHALADILAWLLPVVVLMALAKWVGLRRKIVPLVVATNWGNALLAWAMAPLELLIIASGGSQFVTALAVVASLAALFLMVRLISVALGHDLRAAAAIALLIVLTSMFSYGLVADLSGIALM